LKILIIIFFKICRHYSYPVGKIAEKAVCRSVLLAIFPLGRYRDYFVITFLVKLEAKLL